MVHQYDRGGVCRDLSVGLERQFRRGLARRHHVVVTVESDGGPAFVGIQRAVTGDDQWDSMPETANHAIFESDRARAGSPSHSEHHVHVPTVKRARADKPATRERVVPRLVALRNPMAGLGESPCGPSGSTRIALENQYMHDNLLPPAIIPLAGSLIEGPVVTRFGTEVPKIPNG